MYEITLKAKMIPLADAKDEYGTEVVSLKLASFPWMGADNFLLSTRGFYVVSHREMDWDDHGWDEVFSDLRDAVKRFGKEAKRKFGDGDPVYEKIEWTEDWKCYRDELIPDNGEYHPSATGGDYSPSAPWNAPGMKVSDFI